MHISGYKIPSNQGQAIWRNVYCNCQLLLLWLRVTVFLQTLSSLHNGALFTAALRGALRPQGFCIEQWLSSNTADGMGKSLDLFTYIRHAGDRRLTSFLYRTPGIRSPVNSTRQSFSMRRRGLFLLASRTWDTNMWSWTTAGRPAGTRLATSSPTPRSSQMESPILQTKSMSWA